MSPLPSHTLADLAERFGLRLRGDGGRRIGGVATLANAGAGQLAFLSNGRYAAQLAATEWASGSIPEVHVAGLVVLADAPGRLPKEIREFARVVGGGVPHLWHFPWIEAWRFDHDVLPEELPKEARTVLDQVRIAINTAAGLPAN